MRFLMYGGCTYFYGLPGTPMLARDEGGGRGTANEQRWPLRRESRPGRRRPTVDRGTGDGRGRRTPAVVRVPGSGGGRCRYRWG